MNNKILIVDNDYYEDNIERLYEKYNKGISLGTIQTIYNIIRDYDKCIKYIDTWLEIHKLYTSISEMDMVNALNLTKVSGVNYLEEYYNQVLFDLEYKEPLPNSKRWKIENKNKFHK